MKHTPGPWRIAEVEGGDPWQYEVRAGTIPNYYGVVAKVYGIGEPNANARLIAAAPDLYEALQHIGKLEGQADEYSGAGMVDSAHVKALRSASKIARAALAKAEGRDA